MQEQLPTAGDPRGDRLPAESRHPLAPAANHPTRLFPMEHDEDDAGDRKDKIDFRHYLAILIKRKWTVVSAFGIVVLTALVATLLMTPIYRASATVQIDRDTMKVIQVQGISD